MSALPRPSFAAWAVAALAVLEFGLLVAFAGGYGYHRDELYFIEAGKNLDFGYDDQPPLTPLIGRASTEIFGQTPTGLRVASALAMAACVALCALIARELGGGRRAQVLASACLVAAAGPLYVGHLLSTSTFDFLAWTASAESVAAGRSRPGAADLGPEPGLAGRQLLAPAPPGRPDLR